MIKDLFATFVLFAFAAGIVVVPVGYNLYTAPTEQELYCETVNAETPDECDEAWAKRDQR